MRGKHILYTLKGYHSVQNDKKKYCLFILYSIILINIVCICICININHEFNLEIP